MDHPTARPHFTLLAAAVALAAAGVVPAADKSGPDAPAEKPALKPSLSGKLDAVSLAHAIDRAIDARLAADKVTPSPRADDAEFCRRVYIDLAGHIPSADQAAAFIDGPDPDKRARLIDQLLSGDDYGKHMADVWMNLLVKRNSDNRFVKFDPLEEWLTKNFNEDTPWDQMVRDLMTAEGDQDANPAVTYFLANNSVDKMTDNTTKVFLGLQLQCAQCHNHPFASWKQTDYWGMADFFKRVTLTGPRNPNKQDGVPGIAEGLAAKGRKPMLPDSAKDVPPHLLGGPTVALSGKDKGRPMLARWMTAHDNPYFARAAVNRTWFQLFGRGLANPVDDIAGVSEPSHPQLFADLADQFAANGFDLKYLYRTLCNTQAYQRTSRPTADNAEADASLYAHMAVRVMTPEEQYDSLAMVLAPGRDPRNFTPPNAPKDKPKGARYLNLTPRSLFVAFFENEDANDPTEFQEGIPQALRLMNAPQLNNAQVLNGVLRETKAPGGVIERLYLVALSRRPTPEETQRMEEYVARHKGEAHDGYEDVLWALTNCSEFVMNH